METKPGIYKAKIYESYGIGQTKDGTPYVSVNLKIQTEDGGAFPMQWSGYVHKEKSLEITTKALKVMGMEVLDFAALSAGQGLNKEKVFEVTIADEMTQDGKKYSKVNWINEVGQSGYKTALLDSKIAIAKLQQLGLLSAAAGLKNTDYTSDTIPF